MSRIIPRMAETEDKKVLKMSLICSICLQKLNKPRSLPCFHTFCESCLKNYLINSPEKGNAAKSGIPCPTCKLRVMTPKPELAVANWAENFPMNHLVGTLIDIVPVSSRVEFCEPCKDSQVSKVARSWCQQCSEALCEECTKCHMSMKATKSHEITGLDNVHSNPKPAIKEEVMCKEHPHKDIDMYCQNHDLPCCSVCIATYHRQCLKISQLEDAMKDVSLKNSKQLFKDMDKLVSEAERIKRERHEVMRSTLAQKTKLLEKVAQTKKKLIDHIEKLEAQIIAKFTAVSETDMGIIQEQVDFCNSAQSAMHHNKTAITAAKEQKQPKKELIVSKLGQKKFEEYSTGLQKIRENSAKIQYVFEEDRHVSETLKLLEMLGRLDIKHSYPNRKAETPAPPSETPTTTPRSLISPAEFMPPTARSQGEPALTSAQPQEITQQPQGQTMNDPSPTPKSTPRSKVQSISLTLPTPDTTPRSVQTEAEALAVQDSDENGEEEEEEKKATRKVKTLRVKGKRDRKECKITSVKILRNKTVLLADNANIKLKLYSESGDLLSSFECSNPPWDFTFYEDTKCAVTIPNERKLKVFQVKDKIKEVSWINAARGGYGICTAGKDFAVTFSTGCIRIISKDGGVKMMVDTDYIGKRVFSNPEYIAFNSTNSRIFVSDYNNHNVTALNFNDGKVNQTPVFVYAVSGPRGVSVDAHGNLYVCGFWSNDIHKVKDKGEFRQILMDGLSRPLCISFNDDGDRFALSEQDNPNSVKIFRIIPAHNAED